MPTYSLIKPDGRIDTLYTLPSDAEMDLNCSAPDTWIHGHFDPDDWYFDHGAGVISERPEVPAAANPYPADTCPAGTEITVRDELGDVTVVTDLSSPIRFLDPGSYAVQVAPPFPYQPRSFTVDVP